MTKIAGAGMTLQQEREEEEQKIAARSAVNWKANIDKQRKFLNYSEIFEEDIGQDEVGLAKRGRTAISGAVGLGD